MHSLVSHRQKRKAQNVSLPFNYRDRAREMTKGFNFSNQSHSDELHGVTWDAKHLDEFLKTQDSCQLGSCTVTRRTTTNSNFHTRPGDYFMTRNQRQTCKNTSRIGFSNNFPLIADGKAQSLQDFIGKANNASSQRYARMIKTRYAHGVPGIWKPADSEISRVKSHDHTTRKSEEYDLSLNWMRKAPVVKSPAPCTSATRIRAKRRIPSHQEGYNIINYCKI